MTAPSSASTLVEVCLEDVGGARLAAEAGADALEVGAGLAAGGTTPTPGFVQLCAQEAPGLTLRVLVRCRVGDFVHSGAEVGVMEDDIHVMTERLEGSRWLGFVVGTLRADGQVDQDAVRRLVAAAGGAPVTFHRAFDSVPDKTAALAVLGDLGVTRVLTSGGPGPAVEHLAELADLVRHGGERVRVAVGGGVRPANVARVVEATGAHEVHLRATRKVRPAGRSDGYDAVAEVTSSEVITEVLRALGRREPERPE